MPPGQVRFTGAIPDPRRVRAPCVAEEFCNGCGICDNVYPLERADCRRTSRADDPYGG